MSGYLWQVPDLPQPPADFGPGYHTPTQDGSDGPCLWTAEGTSYPADWQERRSVPHPEADTPRYMRRTGEAVVIAATALVSATLAAQAVRLLPAPVVLALAGWGVFLTLLLGALACAGAEGRRAARGRSRYPVEGD